ncbi:hypothetical protein PDJAM_G00259730 [Pangasius djambal]|nr:hypothetical protein [Pangasius djambal]
MHFLTVFWKVLFACVPPTEYWNGWACFFTSIIIIGFLTAIIGDLASHFGCTIGLKDSVTAVVFVALGTSIPGDEDDDDAGDERLPSCFDYVMHFLTVFWKVLFACVPPTEYWNGWACFFTSIIIIGFLTAIIGDLASHFGCTIGLKDSVTAVVFVALGTSIPDTFASKVAAVQDVYADASIGNVTGSNAVNVFVGLGVAWSVAAVYWRVHGGVFEVHAGSLAFSLTLFSVFSVFAVLALMYRRRGNIGGELGGPRRHRIITTLFFIMLWFLYILLSSLEAYCHIQGF